MSIRTRVSERARTCVVRPRLGALALIVAACSVTALSSTRAIAQERASAEELFQLGKAAMARQELPKACNYFKASLEAEFALGTLLNLAICHEEAGKIASAWAEYRMLEDRARRAEPPQLDRAEFAREHAEALRPRLSRIRIVLSPEAAATKGLTVKIDGVAAAPELFDVGVPVDPGKRTLSASAPDRADWSQLVVVDDERLALEATIPALAPGAPKPAVSQGSSVDLAEIERLSAARSRRAVGYVVGGLGVASLVTGGVFGLLAIGAADDAQCPATCYTTNEARTAPNPALLDARDGYDRANTYGWVANVTLAAGVIGVAAGAYLVLSAGSTPAKKAARLLPLTIASGGGVAIAGSL